MSAIPNPYDPLLPAADPAYFYGREDAFSFFRQQLVGTTHDRALVLIGRRGLGKSALLRQLRYQVDENYVVCIIALSGIEITGEDALYGALVDDIRVTLDLAGASTYRLPQWPPDPGEHGAPVNPRAWFRSDFLAIALAALRLRRLLLILDDAHLILEAIDRGAVPADWLDDLGELLAAHDRFDLVLALDASYENRVLGIDLLSDPALHYRLEELTPDEAARLVRQPVGGITSYADDVVERILSLTGGHPFLIHSICRLLFRRSEERGHSGPITGNDLTAVQTAVLDQADEIFGPLWSGASPNERLTLTALVRLDAAEPGVPVPFDAVYGWLTGAGYAINKTQLAAAVRGLDYNGLIHAEEDRYLLKAGLVSAWVDANTADSSAAPTRTDLARIVPLVGLGVVILIVALLGLAALGGVFDGDDDHAEAATPSGPTATLSLNLEGTRQADFLTQTEAARPTVTATITLTPTLTPTATPTATPSATNTPTSTATATATASRTASRTPTRTPTRDRTATAAASATAWQQTVEFLICATPNLPPPTFPPTEATVSPTARPTNTPRATPSATLDPGG